MPKTMNINVRVKGSLSEFVSSNIPETGDYDNVSEYVRDLIRKDKARIEEKSFEVLKAELQMAFAKPESEYTELSADDVILRNR